MPKKKKAPVQTNWEKWRDYNDRRARRSSQPTLTTAPATRNSSPIYIDYDNIWTTVDDLLDGPTLNDRLQGNPEQASAKPAKASEKPTKASAGSSKAAAKKAPVEESYSECEDSIDLESRLKPRGRNQSRSPSAESSGRYKQSRSPSPNFDRRGSSSRPPSGRKKENTVDLISTGDDESDGGGSRRDRDRHRDRDRDRYRDRRPPEDMRNVKENRRLEDAGRGQEDAKHAKQVATLHDKIGQLKIDLQEKEEDYEDLTTEHQTLKRNYEELKGSHDHLRAALDHIRNHPENAIGQIKKKGSGSRRKVKGDGDQFIDDGPTAAGMITAGKDAVKSIYRVFKFINNYEQEAMFKEMVLDNLGKEELLHKAVETDEQKAIVDEKRKVCADAYGVFWLKELNEHRTYVQSQMKKAILEWMTESGTTELPDPDVFRKHIMIRDFSLWNILESDDESQKQAKIDSKKTVMDLFDMYTEVMVTAIAGTKLYNPKIRHFEPMTTTLLPGTAIDQLRIPASTEAMAVLAYMNNYKKWNASYEYKENNPGSKGKMPMWSTKKPGININFKEAYSCGEEKLLRSEWGGWNDAGRVMYVDLQAEISKSREENLERHVREDKECVKRLYEKYKEMHKDSDRPPKKQKAAPPTDRDEARFKFIVEL